jgi:hypothetical protein
MCMVWLLYIADCFVLDHLNILSSTIMMSHFNFPPVLLLHILYIHLLSKLLTVLSHVLLSHFLYFPHIMLLIILYIHIYTFKYINCIINCNIVSFLYFPHIKLIIVMYIHLQNLKYIKYVNCNIAPYVCVCVLKLVDLHTG